MTKATLFTPVHRAVGYEQKAKVESSHGIGFLMPNTHPYDGENHMYLQTNLDHDTSQIVIITHPNPVPEPVEPPVKRGIIEPPSWVEARRQAELALARFKALHDKYAQLGGE